MSFCVFVLRILPSLAPTARKDCISRNPDLACARYNGIPGELHERHDH